MSARMAMFKIACRAGACCRRGCAALWRNRDGGPLVEFAMIAPPFIALLLAGINTAVMFVAQQTLETAADAVARSIQTGQAQLYQTGGLPQSQFTSAACGSGGNLASFMTCKSFGMTLNAATSYATAAAAPYTVAKGNPSATMALNSGTTGSPTPWQYWLSSATGGQNQILVLQLQYIWPVPTGIFGFALPGRTTGGNILYSTRLITVENYACATGVSTC